MLNANVFGEGVCYTDITHRKLVVLNILKNCHRIISEASNIKRIDEIIASNFFNVNSSDKSSFREFSSLVQSLNPAIIDAIRICVCFENFFKAKLILNGYIIHKIIENQLISKYQCLATNKNLSQ
ncbi:unnamed protein product [marine sediment metagenome]|uniref:Uncharacterized protein n=1 Tax=marine sediment metagenome TaxID=412755 RepID=X1ADY1_9ZZZZ